MIKRLSKKTTIVLADDHEMVRQGFRALLGAEPDLSIVGETGDGLHTVRLVGQLKPDVLMTELMMPGLGGLEIARQVRRKSPQTHVIILTMHENNSYVLEALRNGAAGYVVKSGAVTDLRQAIHVVMAGGRYLSPTLTDLSIESLRPKTRSTRQDRYETLTTREREVLQLSAEGHTLTQIGRRLSISPRTAETHRANMMRKLEIKTQTDLIRCAIERGMVPLPMDRPASAELLPPCPPC